MFRRVMGIAMIAARTIMLELIDLMVDIFGVDGLCQTAAK